MSSRVTLAGIVLGTLLSATSALATCLPVNQTTGQPCISYQGYAEGKSYQGNRHKHYFTNTCKQKLQITFEWVNTVPKKWSHRVLSRGRQSISCLQGVCPGPVVWAPVCRNGMVGASALAPSKAKTHARPVIPVRLGAKPVGTGQNRSNRQDRQIIGTWDFKNTHDCPRHTMGCNGRYDFVAKKSANKYLFRGVISCRRMVKPGVKAKLKSDKTFTTYFDEVWTLKGGIITASSKVTSADSNVSAATLSSTLRQNTFSGSGLTCKGAGRQSWTAKKRAL